MTCWPLPYDDSANSNLSINKRIKHYRENHGLKVLGMSATPTEEICNLIFQAYDMFGAAITYSPQDDLNSTLEENSSKII